MDEEEEDVTGITNVDDVSSEDETEQVETVPTPSTPTSIYPEDDVPLSPLEFSHRIIGGDFSQIVLRSNSGNSIGKKTSHRVGTHFANITLSPPTPGNLIMDRHVCVCTFTGRWERALNLTEKRKLNWPC